MTEGISGTPSPIKPESLEPLYQFKGMSLGEEDGIQLNIPGSKWFEGKRGWSSRVAEAFSRRHPGDSQLLERLAITVQESRGPKKSLNIHELLKQTLIDIKLDKVQSLLDEIKKDPLPAVDSTTLLDSMQLHSLAKQLGDLHSQAKVHRDIDGRADEILKDIGTYAQAIVNQSAKQLIKKLEAHIANPSLSSEDVSKLQKWGDALITAFASMHISPEESLEGKLSTQMRIL